MKGDEMHILSGQLRDKITIDFLVSKRYNGPSMIQESKVKEGLKQRLKHECARLREVQAEMAPLAAAYNRYRDLEDEFKARSKSAERLIVTLGEDGFIELLTHDGFEVIQETFTDVPHFDGPLWESIREILLQAGELREVETQEMLVSLGRRGVPASAIQSALKTHPDVFKIRNLHRKKFVSLKSNK